MKSFYKWAFVASVALLTGCSSTPPDQSPGKYESNRDTIKDTAPGMESEQKGSNVEVIPFGEEGGMNGGALSGGELNDEMRMMDVDQMHPPVIYFDYDQYQLSEDGMATAKHYAQILAVNPNAMLELHGHTDERGSPEYNLALGEKRGNAVAEAMMLFGVQQQRIEVISFGEMQPDIAESNEQAWQKNRRVEIVIQ